MKKKMKKLKDESDLKALQAGIYQHIEHGENITSQSIDFAKFPGASASPVAGGVSGLDCFEIMIQNVIFPSTLKKSATT